MTATRPHHILVVDDEPVNLTLLSKRLAHRGYEVSTAESADAALAIITANRPDLVLLDIFMPRSTRSGRLAVMMARAASADSAVETSYPRCASRFDRSVRFTGSSSTTRM